ncbi:MAG: apolipoprotein N-acyltransferase [Candidatus Omnitrophota bacterium]
MVVTNHVLVVAVRNTKSVVVNDMRCVTISRPAGVFFAVAIFSGLISALSFDFSGGWFFVWFSLVPLLWIIDTAPFKVSFVGSLIFGFVFHVAVIFWVTRVTVPGAIVLFIYLTLYGGLFCILGRYFLKRPFALVTVPAAWVLLEFLQENIWCGFGWANLGYSQYQNLWLVQPADIFGVKCVSFLIVMANVLMYERMRSRIRFRRALPVVCVIIFSCCLYSAFRRATPGTVRPLDVTVVQPNITEEYKWDEGLQAQAIRKLRHLSAQSSASSLVIYPEAAWPRVVDEKNFKELESFIQASGRYSLIGAVAKRRNAFYNTALFFDARGRLLDSYDKIRLVPFGEYIPWRRFLGFISAINSLGDLTRGTRETIFNYRGARFSVLICFEDVLPVFAARFASGNDFLVNITNDDWFGGQPQARQHYGIMIFRAIENRIPIVRAANTGVSGWVTCRGEVEVLKKSGREILIDGTQMFTILLKRQRSFYTAFPELFPFLCGIGLLIVLARLNTGSHRAKKEG